MTVGTAGVVEPAASRDRFTHEAAFYHGPGDLASTVAPFVRAGIRQGESVLVALVPDHAEMLEHELGADAARVEFVDMADLGGNPARIIPAWRRFVTETSGPVRGVGEPAWPGRRRVELDEAALHESLLNLAFDAGRPWRLMCPYDVSALPGFVVEEAVRNHPVLPDDGGNGTAYLGHGHAHELFSAPLPPPPRSAESMSFGFRDLSDVRSLLRRACRRAGLASNVAGDLVLAGHELASNSVTHGGGRGVVSLWTEPEAVLVDVQDAGTIEDPLVGRGLLDADSEGGRGVWIANQLCDLVQVRSRPGHTQVRLHAWR